MKKIVSTLLFAGCFIMLLGQERTQYRIIADDCLDHDCEAVVIAPSGLKLRETPGFSAKKIALIPFGAKVKYTIYPEKYNSTPVVYDADAMAGRWQEVVWQGKQGYVFSAYLGRGILKMEDPFYLLEENAAQCWDDSYIASNYYYYGVFANADTSALTIKACKPTFFNQRIQEGGIEGVAFTLKQQKPSLFAFASKTPFREQTFKISKTAHQLEYHWNNTNAGAQKIAVPGTDWELQYKIEKQRDADGSEYEKPNVIIRDKKTGTWHYLFDNYILIEHCHLQWCGDMDGDGIQDFMLLVGAEHNDAMALFLSGNAGKWKFVRLAGIYYWGDCC